MSKNYIKIFYENVNALLEDADPTHFSRRVMDVIISGLHMTRSHS